MKDNTPRTPASMGEQWVPVPVRLVDDLTRAPTVKRRLWAAAYLLIWVVTFTHARRSGSSPTLGNLEAWTASKARHRTIKAKDDALKALALWEKRTDFEPRTNQKRTAGVQVEPAASDSNEPQTNRKRTAHAGADLHPTDLQDYKTPCSPPAGDADKAVGSVDKSKPVKRKRSAALTLEQIAAVEIPAVLKSLPGWSEAWAMYAEHRQELKSGKWKTPVQVGRMVTKLLKANADGMDVVFALVDSAANGYRGVFPKPPTGKPASEDEPASPAEAWGRVVAGVGSAYADTCPGDLSGWWLWPRSKDATVHTSMMEALCVATGQGRPSYAWQMLRQARSKGPDSYDLNQIGRSWRTAYKAARQAARTAGGDQ